MGKSIVSQPSPSQVLGRAATLMRLLEEAGLPYEKWQLPIDNQMQRSRLVSYWNEGMPRFRSEGSRFTKLEVLSLLGLPLTTYAPAPAAPEDTTVLWYGGWSLNLLFSGLSGLISQESYEKCFHYSEIEKEGYFRMKYNYNIAGSDRLALSGHLNYLESGLYPGEAAPVAIVATALLVSFLAGQEDPLHGEEVICKESGSSLGSRVTLQLRNGRLLLGEEGHGCNHSKHRFATVEKIS